MGNNDKDGAVSRPIGAGPRRGAGAMQPRRRGATSTVEDYLKCILLHQDSEEGESTTVSMGTLGASLGVAPGTVTAMMKTLGEAGLVDYAPYTGVTLNESGRKLATHVLRRHRLIELFLVKIMDLDWSEVHAEAELLEHAISDRLIERMDEMLGFPTVDPHGDPIPTSDGKVRARALPNLMECGTGEHLTVVRVLDQSADFLRTLEKQGVVPGARVQVENRSKASVTLRIDRQSQNRRLAAGAATKVVVEAEVS